MRFQDRVAVVAGGSSGFGRHIAEQLIAEGARVVIAARNEAKLAEVATEIGALAIPCDITDDESNRALVERTLSECGRLDVAVNSAGFEEQTPIRDLSPDKLEPMVAAQLTGPIYFLRHSANAMTEGGTVIMISSLTATLVPENYAAYAGAKAGLNHVVRIAAAEYGPSGIRVNAVSPSIIETPLTQHIFAIPAARSAFLEQTPLGRFGSLTDVTRAVLWLASDEAGYVTGQNLVIDGGTATRKLPGNADVIRHLQS